MTIKHNLTVLGLYWLIASSSFIWSAWILNKISLFNIAESILLSVLALVLLVWSVFSLCDHPFSVVFIPVIMPLICLVRIIFLTNDISLRSSFCAISIIAFILLFNAIIYFEKTTALSVKHADLVHNRYLEFLRSFVWLITFGLVGYLTWELSWALNVLKPGLEFNDTASQCPLIIGLLRLTSVFSAGIGLISYAFYVKLRDIERI